MRGEVLVGPERRRRWSEDEKARIIEESLRPGAQVTDIARRHGVSRALLYSWRRAARCAPVSPVAPPAPEFVPVLLSAPEEPPSTSALTETAIFGPRITALGQAADQRRWQDRGRSAWRRTPYLARPGRGEGTASGSGRSQGMIAVSSGLKVLVATKPIDFRKGMDGLAALVKEHL